jgi:hypothetical protein
LGVFHSYVTEEDALAAFAGRAEAREEHATSQSAKILCIDPSSDLLAYMTAVKPHVVVCGPGVPSSSPAFEKFRRLDPRTKFLLLPADFHTADGCDAGVDLVKSPPIAAADLSETGVPETPEPSPMGWNAGTIRSASTR